MKRIVSLSDIRNNKGIFFSLIVQRKRYSNGISTLIALLFSLGIIVDVSVAGNIEAGRTAYTLHCARCHGPEGRGDGPDAHRVPVLPRNLTEGIIKFKSTEQGTPPSDEDFLWIMNHGMSHSGMPSFANLNQKMKMDIIAYIRSLSSEYTSLEPKPLPIPFKNVKVDLKKGREIYNQLQCGLCHGENGRANGSSAFSLVDTWKNPIAAATLPQGWTYRAGATPTQIYYRLMAGISGAPMPSYDGAVSQEDAWQLSNFISSTQWAPNWALDLKVANESVLPVTETSETWDKAVPTDIPLQSVYYSKGKRQKTSIHAARIQAITNKQEISFRVQWFDPTKDENKNVDSVLLAVKTADFKGAGLDNLYTLYTADAPKMPMLLWKADRPSVVSEFESNLSDIIEGRAKLMAEHSSQSVYEDGLWTLVFNRKLSDGEFEKFVSVGIAAWDGLTNQAKHSQSVSKWILFSSGNNAAHH